MNISRLKSTLKRKIILSKNIYVIGHDNLDLDAFGAMVGIVSIANKYHKNCFTIIDDKEFEPGVEKALLKLKNKLKVIKTAEIKDFNNSVLIVVDTNKKYLLSCEKVLNKFSSIIIIDHHDTDKNTIKTNNMFIYQNISSTCEIITELIRSFKIKIFSEIATILLSGIVLDTNNFILRATKDTFYNAYYLLKEEASTIEVQYLLKQDLKKFINRQKMLTNVKIVNKKIAIAKGVKDELYRREDLAKIAETLLLFNNIETSFVIGKLDSSLIGISGRTLGKLNIGNLMNNLGGGGSSNEAATKISSDNISEVENMLLKEIEK